MLVLSRKRGEEIVLDVGGMEIVVAVTDACAGQAKIGIEAPKDVVIHRREIWDQIKRSREAEK